MVLEHCEWVILDSTLGNNNATLSLIDTAKSGGSALSADNNNVSVRPFNDSWLTTVGGGPDISIGNSAPTNPADQCFEPIEVNFVRFTLIVIVACSIAVFGVFNNYLLLKFFSRKYNSSTLYLAVLAFLDTGICLIYIVVFGGDAVALYFRVFWLWIIWNEMVIVLFFLSKAIQLSATYIIVFATFERWLIVGNRQGWVPCLTSHRGRSIIIISIIIFSTALNVPTFFELMLVHAGCPSDPFGRIQLNQNFDFLMNDWYQYYHRVRMGIQVFLPFIKLTCLNVGIILELHLQSKKRQKQRLQRLKELNECVAGGGEAAMDNVEAPAADAFATLLNINDRFRQRLEEISEKRIQTRQIRGATRTILVITFSYLLCNSLSLSATFLEELPHKPLITYTCVDEAGQAIQVPTAFYLVVSDLISFLFMFNCFMRIFIHLSNYDVRKEFGRYYWQKWQAVSTKISLPSKIGKTYV